MNIPQLNGVRMLLRWAQRIGVGWLSWTLTHETFWVGLIALAQILPLITFPKGHAP